MYDNVNRGPEDGMDAYVACFKDNVKWIKGMNGSEKMFGILRGRNLLVLEKIRPYKKHVAPDDIAEIWFHGILQTEHTQMIPIIPANAPEEMYYALYGEYPMGEFYNAYKLVKSFRDGMQKALWVNPKRNPKCRKNYSKH